MSDQQASDGCAVLVLGVILIAAAIVLVVVFAPYVGTTR